MRSGLRQAGAVYGVKKQVTLEHVVGEGLSITCVGACQVFSLKTLLGVLVLYLYRYVIT